MLGFVGGFFGWFVFFGWVWFGVVRVLELVGVLFVGRLCFGWGIWLCFCGFWFCLVWWCVGVVGCVLGGYGVWCCILCGLCFCVICLFFIYLGRFSWVVWLDWLVGDCV